ncbi:MAG: hypothetical protein ACFWT6_12175 [Virgibacillus proomii]|jgi:hypothetical protein
MTELQKWRQKIQHYINTQQDMTNEEVREALKFISEITMNNIDRAIEANEKSIEQNEVLLERLETEKVCNNITLDFIRAKGLEKEFEFYITCQDNQTVH